MGTAALLAVSLLGAWAALCRVFDAIARRAQRKALEALAKESMELGLYNWVRDLAAASVSAGERVRQTGRFGGTPTAGLSGRKYTSTLTRVSAAGCNQVGADRPFRTSCYPPRRPREHEEWMTTCAWYPS
jgi:hypothetical protein